MIGWSGLERMMLDLGFDKRWVALIMKCVSTLTYSVLLSMENKKAIFPLVSERFLLVERSAFLA